MGVESMVELVEDVEGCRVELEHSEDEGDNNDSLLASRQMRQAEAFACIVRLLCLLGSGGCTAGEVDLDFDALVQLLRHLDLL